MLIVSVQKVSPGLGREYFWGGEKGAGVFLFVTVSLREKSVYKPDMMTAPDLDYVWIYVGPHGIIWKDTHEIVNLVTCGGGEGKDGGDSHS